MRLDHLKSKRNRIRVPSARNAGEGARMACLRSEPGGAAACLFAFPLEERRARLRKALEAQGRRITIVYRREHKA